MDTEKLNKAINKMLGLTKYYVRGHHYDDNNFNIIIVDDGICAESIDQAREHFMKKYKKNFVYIVVSGPDESSTYFMAN